MQNPSRVNTKQGKKNLNCWGNNKREQPRRVRNEEGHCEFRDKRKGQNKLRVGTKSSKENMGQEEGETLQLFCDVKTRVFCRTF